MGASVLFDAPGPRARIRNRLLTLLTVAGAVVLFGLVISRMAAKDQLTSQKWEPFLTPDLWRTYVLPGVEGTLTAAAVSIVLAGILGMLLGVARLAPIRPVRWVSAVIVEFFRAVPVLIMMIFAYFLYALYDVFPSNQLALAGVITGLHAVQQRGDRRNRAGRYQPCPVDSARRPRRSACRGPRRCA